jgi:hypothetical protein
VYNPSQSEELAKTSDLLVVADSAQQRFSAKTDNFSGQTSGRILIVLTVIPIASAKLFGTDIQTNLTRRSFDPDQ